MWLYWGPLCWIWSIWLESRDFSPLSCLCSHDVTSGHVILFWSSEPIRFITVRLLSLFFNLFSVAKFVYWMFKWCEEEWKKKSSEKGKNPIEENWLLISHFPPFECADVSSKFFDTQLFCYFFTESYSLPLLDSSMSPAFRIVKRVFESVFLSFVWNKYHKTMCDFFRSRLWEICECAALSWEYYLSTFRHRQLDTLVFHFTWFSECTSRIS